PPSVLTPPPTLPSPPLFSQCRPPPALRSFPTRRSSDLLEKRVSYIAALGFCECIAHSAADDECVYFLKQVVDNGDLAGYFGSAEDRKSTRLNSSHVSISYAVFCLTKKMKQGAPLEWQHI